MIQPLIIWSKHKLEALEEAIEIAEAGGLDTVTWTEQAKPSRWAKGVEHTWPMAEARTRADQVRVDLHLNPMPVFPENREGKEP